MQPDDYQTADAFFRKVASYFAAAHAQRGENRPALIVFPEDFATFLLLEGRRAFIDRAQTLDEAFRAMALHDWRRLLATLWRYRTLKTRAAFFTALAPRVWEVWRHTMTTLAKEYGMTVVAGTALLPDFAAETKGGPFRPVDARVYNVSFTVNPEGQVISVTRKVNLVPTQEDVLQLTPGPLEQALAWSYLPGTRIKLATAICYDGFCCPHTPREPHFTNVLARLDDAGVQVVAQPSANPWRWDEPWPFDDARERPARTRAQQWYEEGAFASLTQCRAVEVVVNPQLIMEFLDLHFDGQSAIFARDGQAVAPLALSRATRGPEADEVLHAVWRPRDPAAANARGESKT
ncbi:MAG: hypothetical protein OWU84_04600 [Firmicutes bacterium]|nr:hypothetical protein [Bacillota bacterium]